MKLLVYIYVHQYYCCSDESWRQWKAKYGKQYMSKDEDSMRKIIWENNLQYIEKHNSHNKYAYKLAANKMADMTNKEFRQQYLGYIPIEEGPIEYKHLYNSIITDIPTSVDWRTKGYVTKVKDQKQCGSCWAFSAAGSLEGQYFTGQTNYFLSEQQLVDCSRKEGNEGCDGGDMVLAFKYYEKYGAMNESVYSYLGRDAKCKFDENKAVAKVTGYKKIPKMDCNSLKNAAAVTGPISVAMDASHNSFQIYSSGIYDPKRCGKRNRQLDHGVLVVGYGTESGEDFWLIKNSWGEDWGMQGYFKIAVGKDECGICTSASFPTV
uniref:Cathepsin L 2 n=1 Tax=Pheronema raphanus TaxID=667001 RepID=C8CBD0_9METZ|nr:cathepsin L 2 [Pheronema raphanus]